MGGQEFIRGLRAKTRKEVRAKWAEITGEHSKKVARDFEAAMRGELVDAGLTKAGRPGTSAAKADTDAIYSGANGTMWVAAAGRWRRVYDPAAPVPARIRQIRREFPDWLVYNGEPLVVGAPLEFAEAPDNKSARALALSPGRRGSPVLAVRIPGDLWFLGGIVPT